MTKLIDLALMHEVRFVDMKILLNDLSEMNGQVYSVR